ncbi:MAG: glycosyltransferase family 4 protein [Ktedonobacteraceae bacterium]
MAEKKLLNVLMVTAQYFPVMGGIETHVHEVGRRLAQVGVGVTVLTTLPSAGTTVLPSREVVEGMDVIRVPAWPRQRDYYLAPEMYSVIREKAWDLVHCQGCHTLVPPLAMTAARMAHLPYILTFHTGGHSSPLRSRMRAVQWQLQRQLYAHATRLIGVSHFETDYFRAALRLPAQRFSVISNGSTLPQIESSTQPRDAEKIIMSVGRLERYKGHQHLITALPWIRRRYPRARLLILGKGPYEGALHELGQKIGVSEWMEIRAVPAQDRSLMARTLAQASLVALLSEYEANPVAVMEAVALQRPVLVANNSGLKELADQGFARAVALDSTPAEIARAACEQLEDPIMAPTDVHIPTWDDCAQQVLSIYKEVVGRHSCAF